jgi:hypothetical protein
MDNRPDLDEMMTTLLSAVDKLSNQLPSMTAGAASGDQETDALLNNLTSMMQQNIANLRKMISKNPRAPVMTASAPYASNSVPTAEELMNGNWRS